MFRLLLVASGFVAIVPAAPQIGGDGSSGPLTPTSTITLDTGANAGVFQFTTIAIPAGVTVRVRGPNPARFLCQGSVIIEGILDASASTISKVPPVSDDGQPGPGGWAGGSPGYGSSGPGAGPGGGAGGLFTVPPGGAAHANIVPGYFASALPYGSAFPFDLRGGSGGGGGNSISRLYSPGPGTSGGGAIAILADGPITITGKICAAGGGVIYYTEPWAPRYSGGAAGSGGAILIRSLGAVRVQGKVFATKGWSWNTFQGPIPLDPEADGGTRGEGFVRIDSYGGPPDASGATIQPKPMIAELPCLRELAQPSPGETWRVRCAAGPGDVLGLWIALRTLASPFESPFGTVHLDTNPGGGLVFIGTFTVPFHDTDPLAAFDFVIPRDPRIRGLVFHSQMFDVLPAARLKPRLSNLLTSQVE